MEIKKINRLLLGIFLLHIAVAAALTIFQEVISLGTLLNLLLGEIILFVPTLLYLWGFRGKLGEQLHFHKIRPTTLFYVVFFTWLSMPLTTLVNAISMLFVDNTVAAMSPYLLELPFGVMLCVMAVVPAFCEEIVFRGVVYGGYRQSGNKLYAVLLSAFMFGVMHMNLNQALYAFVIGILLALLLEATGSIAATMLFHFLYNAQSCCMMYLVEAFLPGYYEQTMDMTAAASEMYLTIVVYFFIAAIATPLAGLLLYKIAKRENRTEQLKAALSWKKTGENRLVTVSYAAAAFIAIAYIVFDILVSKW